MSYEEIEYFVKNLTKEEYENLTHITMLICRQQIKDRVAQNKKEDNDD